jgi:glycosyltransferase involved in cell wall biosynthesis
MPGAPIVNTRHGAGAARNDLRERFYRASLFATARVVAVSEHARNHFIDERWVAADRICVIPNGIRVENFRGPAQESVRVELGLGPNHHVVGIVGRLNWAKDHEFLLRAWAQVQREDAAARLLVIGDGELRAKLDASAARLGVASTIMWLSDRSDVPRLLHGLDVLALSSRTEGYSIALLEGAAAGVPMVATDVGGNREIVADGVTGVVVPHGDEVALSRALLDLLNDPPRRARYGAAAAAWAAQAAGIDTMQRRYADLYRSLLAGAR